MRRIATSAFLAGLFWSHATLAQTSDEELAKQLANPISSLISVPFQHNWDCCYGPSNGGRYTLNFQPVIPLALTPEWNVIVRTIVPLIYQERTSPTAGSQFGIGNTLQSYFFSPSHPVNGITWGFGPAILYPTTESLFGVRTWGAGPTGVILKQEGGWTYGVLANHVWSEIDSVTGNRVNSTFIQPFISYTFPDTTTITLNTESTYDWVNKAWTVPVIGQVSRVFRFGEQRVSLGAGGKYYAVAPANGPEWGARAFATLLFPK